MAMRNQTTGRVTVTTGDNAFKHLLNTFVNIISPGPQVPVPSAG